LPTEFTKIVRNEVHCVRTPVSTFLCRFTYWSA